MREAVFILLVLAVLFSLTALRYRRQIKSLLRIWRTLQQAKVNVLSGRPAGRPGSAESVMVSCAKCGKWIIEDQGIRVPPASYYCSRVCLENFAAVR